MEVHKHPHHVTHKKKWAEYLLEFLMLFLAVFLGFIAENLRENAAEHRRIKTYIKQMAEDLKSDISRCNLLIMGDRLRQGDLDSVREELNLIRIHKGSINKAYYFYFRPIPYPYAFVRPIKEAAITQLKSSGNFRLIENKDLANKILDYYENHRTEGQVNWANSIVVDLRQSRNIFDPEYFSDWLRKDTVPYAATTSEQHSHFQEKENYYKAFLNNGIQLRLLSDDPTQLKRFNILLIELHKATYGFISSLKLDILAAENLLNQIHANYSLQD